MVVHIIGADHTQTPSHAPAGIPLLTIVLAQQRQVKPAGTACVAHSTAAGDAFAQLVREEAEALAATEVPADQDGWLRQRRRPGDPDAWDRPSTLNAAIRDIAAHPLAVTADGGLAHHH